MSRITGAWLWFMGSLLLDDDEARGVVGLVGDADVALRPRDSNQSASTPLRRISGFPLGRLTTSQPRQVIGIRDAEADRLRERLLGGKARRQVADAALLELGPARGKDGKLVDAEDALGEAVAAPRQDGADAADVADVGADAEDHRADAKSMTRR